ncbi:MAG TPA: hypothetical protein VIA10_13705 [Gaiellaceae bacterium]|jgi:hypothetical protein
MRVVVTVGVALALALPGAAAPPRRATLKLDSVSPLVVRGLGFGRAERVAVVASQPGMQQIVSLTARQGRFTATFTQTFDRCTALTVRAIGAQGSRAILQRDGVCPPSRDQEKERKKPPSRR